MAGYAFLAVAVLLALGAGWWAWWLTGDGYRGAHVRPPYPARHRAVGLDDPTVEVRR